ncbi:MAG: dihydropteroate synthase [Candidatus Eisenbacteria bacterium]
MSGLEASSTEALARLLLSRGIPSFEGGEGNFTFDVSPAELETLSTLPPFHELGPWLGRALRGPDRASWLRAWGIPAARSGTIFMGVLNVTPNSFSDGGRFADEGAAVEWGLALVREGADLVDVGGESTRPGAAEVPPDEEIRRAVPVIRALAGKIEKPLSIDTRKGVVARAAAEAGAAVINDVTGLTHDPELARVAAETGCGLVIGHIRGTPADMQENPRYRDPVAEVYDELARSAEIALGAGVAEEKIAVDPGIGFGKRVEDNLRLLRRLFEIRSLGFPILVGPSRKSFLGAILGLPVEERLEGTIGASVSAVLHGADILRIHDVRAVSRAVRTAEAIEGA